MTAPLDRPSRPSAAVLAFLTLVGVAALWSYWTTLTVVAARWATDPQYSHGYLVPAFAAYLLWLRRDRLAGQTLYVNGLGLGLILAAMALRLTGTHYHFDYFDQVSLLPCLAGMFLLMGSWPAFFWSLPAVGFLAFMIPLPHKVSLAMSGPMQSFATTVSTFFLQAIGRPALAEGNIILLNDIELGIVEACSGLRMLVVFFALSTAVAMLIRKPLWEKLVIAFSAVPIALTANVLRITVTGLFYDSFGNHFGGAFFHDLAGWLMMPLGLVLLGVELWILRTLLIETSRQPLAAVQPGTQSSASNPISLYQGGPKSRRQKTAPPAVESTPEPEPVAVEV